MEFEDFWHPVDPTITVRELLELQQSKGVQDVQSDREPMTECGQAQMTQYQGCPPCPSVQSRGFGIAEKQNQSTEIVGSSFSSTPNEVGGQTVDSPDNSEGVGSRTGHWERSLPNSLSPAISLPSTRASTDSISEWMSEENLQSMADDLEECEDIEMFRLIREVYNTEALKVAESRISLGKQKQICLWMAQLDG